MRSIAISLISALSVLGMVVPNRSNAAIIRQNFELEVDRTAPGSANLPLPRIGTQGRGSFTYDEAQIQLAPQFSVYENVYSLGTVRQPIHFSDFSLDFFGRAYSSLRGVQARISSYLLFDRTPSGQYTPRSLLVDAFDNSSTVRFLDNGFVYYAGNPFVESPGVVGSAGGPFRFTEAEGVPEPPAAAIASVLGLGLVWLCQRKRTKN